MQATSLSGVGLYLRRVLAMAVAGLFVCGVSDARQAGSPSAAPQTERSEAWHLTFRMSGGLAGLNRLLDLSSLGTATVTDGSRGRRVSARVPHDDLLMIEALVAKARAFSDAGPGVCRDCLNYDVDVRLRGTRLVLHLNDATLADAGAEGLIAALRNLQARVLSER